MDAEGMHSAAAQAKDIQAAAASAAQVDIEGGNAAASVTDPGIGKKAWSSNVHFGLNEQWLDSQVVYGENKLPHDLFTFLGAAFREKQTTPQLLHAFYAWTNWTVKISEIIHEPKYSTLAVTQHCSERTACIKGSVFRGGEEFSPLALLKIA